MLFSEKFQKAIQKESREFNLSRFLEKEGIFDYKEIVSKIIFKKYLESEIKLKYVKKEVEENKKYPKQKEVRKVNVEKCLTEKNSTLKLLK